MPGGAPESRIKRRMAKFATQPSAQGPAGDQFLKNAPAQDIPESDPIAQDVPHPGEALGSVEPQLELPSLSSGSGPTSFADLVRASTGLAPLQSAQMGVNSIMSGGFGDLVARQNRLQGNSMGAEPDASPEEIEDLRQRTVEIREMARRNRGLPSQPARSKPSGTAIGSPDGAGPELQDLNRDLFPDTQEMMAVGSKGVHTPLPAGLKSPREWKPAQRIAESGLKSLDKSRTRLHRDLRQASLDGARGLPDNLKPAPAKSDRKKKGMFLWEGGATAPGTTPQSEGGALRAPDKLDAKAKALHKRSGFRSIFKKQKQKQTQELAVPGLKEYGTRKGQVEVTSGIGRVRNRIPEADIGAEDGVEQEALVDPAAFSDSGPVQFGANDSSQNPRVSSLLEDSDSDDDFEISGVEGLLSSPSVEKQRAQQRAAAAAASAEALAIPLPPASRKRRQSVDLTEGRDATAEMEQEADAQHRALLTENLMDGTDAAGAPRTGRRSIELERDFDSDLGAMLPGAKAFDADRARAVKEEERQKMFPDLGSEVSESFATDEARRKKGRAEVVEGREIKRKIFSRTAEDPEAAPYAGEIFQKDTVGPDALEQAITSRSGNEFISNRDGHGVYRNLDRPGFSPMDPTRLRYQRDANSPQIDVTDPQKLLAWERETQQRNQQISDLTSKKQGEDAYITKRGQETGFTKFRRNIARSFKNVFGGRKTKLRNARAESGRLGQEIAAQQQVQVEGDAQFGNRSVRERAPEGVAGSSFKAEVAQAWSEGEAGSRARSADTDKFAAKRNEADEFYNHAQARADDYLNSAPKNVTGADEIFKPVQGVAEPKFNQGEYRVDNPMIAPFLVERAKALGLGNDVAEQLAANTAQRGRADRFEEDAASYPERAEKAKAEDRRRREEREKARPGLADLLAEKESQFPELAANPQQMLTQTSARSVGMGSGDYLKDLEREKVRRIEKEMLPKYAPTKLPRQRPASVGGSADWGDNAASWDAIQGQNRGINEELMSLGVSNAAERFSGAKSALESLQAQGQKNASEFADRRGNHEAARRDISSQMEAIGDQRSAVQAENATSRSQAHAYDVNAFKKEMGLSDAPVGSMAPSGAPQTMAERDAESAGIDFRPGQYAPDSPAAREYAEWQNQGNSRAPVSDNIADLRAALAARIAQHQVQVDENKASSAVTRDTVAKDKERFEAARPTAEEFAMASAPKERKRAELRGQAMGKFEGSAGEAIEPAGKTKKDKANNGEKLPKSKPAAYQPYVPPVDEQPEVKLAARPDALVEDYAGDGVKRQDENRLREARGLGSVGELVNEIRENAGPDASLGAIKGRMNIEEASRAKEAIEIIEARKQGRVLGDIGNSPEDKALLEQQAKERLDSRWQVAEGQIQAEAKRRQRPFANVGRKKDDRYNVSQDAANRFAQELGKDVNADPEQGQIVQELLQEFNNKRMGAEKLGLVTRFGANTSKAPASLPGDDPDRLAGFLAGKGINTNLESGERDEVAMAAFSQSPQDFVTGRFDQRMAQRRDKAKARSDQEREQEQLARNQQIAEDHQAKVEQHRVEMQRQEAALTREAVQQHLAQEQAKNKGRIRLNDPNRLDVAMDMRAEQRKREAAAEPNPLPQPGAPSVASDVLPTNSANVQKAAPLIAQGADSLPVASRGNINIDPKSVKNLKAVQDPAASSVPKKNAKSALAGENYKQEMLRIKQENQQKGRAEKRRLEAEAAKRPQLPEGWADQLQEKVSQNPLDRDVNAALQFVGSGEPKNKPKKRFLGLF